MADKVRASHILCKHITKDQAISEIQAIINRLRNDPSEFQMIAQDRSDCSSSSRGGDLGFFGKGEMQRAFEQAAFSLKVGEISGVVDTDSGIHVILRTGEYLGCMASVKPPELKVVVLELRDMKHDGGHSVEVRFGDRSTRSSFVEGYGAFKVMNYAVSFRVPVNWSLSAGFWEEGRIQFFVRNQRLLADDKVVGSCAVPIQPARGKSHTAWYSLIYKGAKRGSVKIRIASMETASPAASATVPSSRPPRTQCRNLPTVSTDWPQ